MPFVIPDRVWKDPRFQELWNLRFRESCRVPRQMRKWRRLNGEPNEREAQVRRLTDVFKRVRNALYAALVGLAGEACEACDSILDLQVDHVLPLRWGGTNEIFNTQLLCGACNMRKAGNLPTPPGKP
jgi:hypothetical protein